MQRVGGGAGEERQWFVSALPLRDESKCWLCLKLLGLAWCLACPPLSPPDVDGQKTLPRSEQPFSLRRMNFHWAVKLQRVCVTLPPCPCLSLSRCNDTVTSLWRQSSSSCQHILKPSSSSKRDGMEVMEVMEGGWMAAATGGEAHSNHFF